MTMLAGGFAEQSEALHDVLLRLAGLVPDNFISEARDLLGEGDLLAAAQSVVLALVGGQVAIEESDARLLEATLADGDEDAGIVSGLPRRGAEVPYVTFGFAPIGPAQLAAGDTVPYRLDLTAAETFEEPVDDAIRDGFASGAVPADVVLAVWRVWRYPPRGTEEPAPRRVYLVQVAPQGSRPVIVGVLQGLLRAAGETDAQVEAFSDVDGLPPYQSTALEFSALLWTSQASAPLRLVNTKPDPTGYHAGLDDEETRRVLAYLSAGAALIIEPDRELDVVDKAAGAVVPAGYRTDGTWIWSEAAAYYLSRYGLAPDAGLLEHIREAGYVPPGVNEVSLHRALVHYWEATA